MLHCPKCASERIRTYNILADGGRNIKRRSRRCENSKCGHKFRTIELLESEVSHKYETEATIQKNPSK
jgi:transcriptional regulator NrdR family protein